MYCANMQDKLVKTPILMKTLTQRWPMIANHLPVLYVQEPSWTWPNGTTIMTNSQKVHHHHTRLDLLPIWYTTFQTQEQVQEGNATNDSSSKSEDDIEKEDEDQLLTQPPH